MAELNVKLDNNIVETYIRKAIAEALSKDPSELVKIVVDEAMNAKSNSYSRKSLFQESVENMIRNTAKEYFKEWLNQHKILIKDAIDKRLSKEKSDFVESIANQIINGLSKSFYVTANLRIDD